MAGLSSRLDSETKMTKNEHTGASQMTKPATEAFRSGWDRIFGGASVAVSTGVCETPSEGSTPRATPFTQEYLK